MEGWRRGWGGQALCGGRWQSIKNRHRGQAEGGQMAGGQGQAGGDRHTHGGQGVGGQTGDLKSEEGKRQTRSCWKVFL